MKALILLDELIRKSSQTLQSPSFKEGSDKPSFLNYAWFTAKQGKRLLALLEEEGLITETKVGGIENGVTFYTFRDEKNQKDYVLVTPEPFFGGTKWKVKYTS